MRRVGARAEKKIKGNSVDDSKGFSAGILVAKGSIGKMAEIEAETMSVGKTLGKFDACTEFGIEAEINSAGGIVVTTTETWSEHPAATNLNVQQHSDCGVELVVIAGTEGHPGTEMIESEGGAIFNVPEKLLVAVEEFRSASAQTEQRRITYEPSMRGGRENHRAQNKQRNERDNARIAHRHKSAGSLIKSKGIGLVSASVPFACRWQSHNSPR